MNLAIDLPDDVLVLVNNLPDQRSFLIEAIRREWQRRKALAQLNRLSEQVSNRHPELTDQQLDDLLNDWAFIVTRAKIAKALKIEAGLLDF